jgi:hypothetical protein
LLDAVMGVFWNTQIVGDGHHFITKGTHKRTKSTRIVREVHHSNRLETDEVAGAVGDKARNIPQQISKLDDYYSL